MFSTMKRQKTTLSSSQQLFSSTDFDLPDDCWERIFQFLLTNNDDHNRRYYLNSLSAVSKQLLSITDSFRFSLTISNQTLAFLPHLFQRFTNLTTLDISCYYGDHNVLLTQISSFPLKLTSLNLSNQHVIPTNGLRVFSQNIITLISLTCSNIDSICSTDINFIADCFPLLEELDLSYPTKFISHTNNFLVGVEALSLTLFRLRKVNLSGHYYINNKLIFNLFKNCKHLEEVVLLECYQITNTDVVASALRERPTLRSLSLSPIFSSQEYGIFVTSHFIDSLVSLKGLACLELSYWRISDQLLSSIAMENLPLRRLALKYCTGYSYSGIFCLLSKCQRFQHLVLQKADFLSNRDVVELSSFLGDLVSINLSECSMLTESALFALTRNCPSLNEVIMARTSIGFVTVENSSSLMNCVVNPQFKYLRLAKNYELQNKKIIMFASVFPNLQLLDLSDCFNISEEGICQVLRKCSKIRHLNLSRCSIVKLQGITFEIPKLEVLNLSNTRVDDESLHVISKRCRGILKLSLQNCNDITNEGVMHVVGNCTQLREINLHHCDEVHANIVVSMVLLRPSLRKIAAPPDFPLSDENRKLVSRHGCLLE